MISRVAEHCYWMSRYLERAENSARVLEVNQTLLLDFELPLEQQWKPLLTICGVHDYTASLESEAVQAFMTWDKENPSSITSSIAFARENARIIREIISADMWERMNYYYLWMQNQISRHLYENNRSDFYGQIRRINQLLHGIAEGTMLHGEAWEFFQLGKYLERACQTARILDVKYHMVSGLPEPNSFHLENAHWSAILKSCSAYEPFHKQHHSLERRLGASVAEFLVFDPIFPRSIVFCVEQSLQAVHAISGNPRSRPKNDVETMLRQLSDWLQTATIDGLMASNLHKGLTHVVDSVHEIGDACRRTFFDFQREPAQQTQEQNGQRQTQGSVPLAPLAPLGKGAPSEG
jgi:uncharacterized alpha-E superfamily protein